MGGAVSDAGDAARELGRLALADAAVILQIAAEGPGLEVLQGALRALRLWAQARGVLGAAFGYLAPVSCAVLVACAARGARSLTAEELLARVFQQTVAAGLAAWCGALLAQAASRTARAAVA